MGVAKALGELYEAALTDSLVVNGSDSNGAIWSSKASCSSGAKLDNCHIFILSSDDFSTLPLAPKESTLCAVSVYIVDGIDLLSILKLLAQVNAGHGKVIQVFAKAEADPRGHIRGGRHTMNTDSDLHSIRHTRAAVGELIAGLTGDYQVYVSGGAEGQGQVGGGSLSSLSIVADSNGSYRQIAVTSNFQFLSVTLTSLHLNFCVDGKIGYVDINSDQTGLISGYLHGWMFRGRIMCCRRAIS